MADVAQQPAAQQAAPAAQDQQGGGGIFGNFFGGLVRMLVIMTLFNTLTSYLRGPPKDTTTGKVLPPHAPMWPIGQEFSFQTYFSPEQDSFAGHDPVWREKFIYFNSQESNIRKLSVNFTATDAKLSQYYKHITNNGSLFVHTIITRRGASADPNDVNFNPRGFMHVTYQINRHHKIKKNKRRNLLAAQTNETAVAETAATEEDRYGNYWNSELYLHMVDFHEAMPNGQAYPHIKDHLKFDGAGQDYYPVIYYNDFWTLKEHLLMINETVENIPLTITFEPLSPWKWQIYLQMGVSMKMQQAIGSVSEGQEDEFKRLLLETNPYLLGLTMVVSLLHSLFDFLAFKNDIEFWKTKKNMDGTSVKTIMLNCVFQAIILLYLFDNDTNWLILISSVVGLGIEVWKVKKAVVFKRKESFPYITFDDRADYVSRTKEYDDTAMTYLFYAAIPLLIGYAVYSVMYETHKSWYSFFVGTAVGFIYTFGFIMMTPQLFINYKLKSVAHMPWKAFMYKALNTFIDDLFSFIVKMPTLHRLSCFRDDIIFFIYLYQRWVYPIDPKRSNEFGQTGEDEQNQAAVQQQQDGTNATPAAVASDANTTTETPAVEQVQEQTTTNVAPAEQQAAEETAKIVPEVTAAEEPAEEPKAQQQVRKRKTTRRDE